MADIPSFRRESLMASSVWLFVLLLCVLLECAAQTLCNKRLKNSLSTLIIACDSSVCSGILRCQTNYRLPAFVPYIPRFVIHYRIENTRILFRNITQIFGPEYMGRRTSHLNHISLVRGYLFVAKAFSRDFNYAN